MTTYWVSGQSWLHSKTLFQKKKFFLIGGRGGTIWEWSPEVQNLLDMYKAQFCYPVSEDYEQQARPESNKNTGWFKGWLGKMETLAFPLWQLTSASSPSETTDHTFPSHFSVTVQEVPQAGGRVPGQWETKKKQQENQLKWTCFNQQHKEEAVALFAERWGGASTGALRTKGLHIPAKISDSLLQAIPDAPQGRFNPLSAIVSGATSAQGWAHARKARCPQLPWSCLPNGRARKGICRREIGYVFEYEFWKSRYQKPLHHYALA